MLRCRCKECGGAGLCTHGKVKYYCKECSGAGMCTHGRRKSQCKECDSGPVEPEAAAERMSIKTITCLD